MRILTLLLLLAGFIPMSPPSIAFSARADQPGNISAAPIPGSDEAVRWTWEAWNAPVKPFRIIGNVYYVGVAGVSSFLVTTPEGHILIDTGFETTVPRITNSLHQLGFRLRDIQILLSSHAHLDHTGGHALMKSLTGAQISISEADAALLAMPNINRLIPAG